MKRIKYYRIDSACKLFELDKIVNRLIKDGWTPLGGVTILTGNLPSSRYEYIQSCVMYKKWYE